MKNNLLSLKAILNNPKFLYKILPVLITVLFFIPALMITIKGASPYCRADDWRFVTMYLEPLYSGNFSFRLLWRDPVHPMPVYALLFISSAKLYDLQINYIAWFSIFFQLALALLIISSVLKSIRVYFNKPWRLILTIIGVNSIVFSFVGTPTFFWPIMTHCFIGLSFVYLTAYFIDNVNNKLIISEPGYREFFKLPIVIILSLLIFSDWTIIFSIAIILVIFIISIVNKSNRNRRLLLAAIILLSLLLGYLFLNNLIINHPRNLKSELSSLPVLFFENFSLTFKTISNGLFSSIIDFKAFTRESDNATHWFTALSIIFMIFYLVVLVLYFFRKTYKSSIIPPAMMLFTLAFLLSVLLFRYNPLEHGQFCMIIPRYIIFYQFGIIGFIWALFLLFNRSIDNEKRKQIKKYILIAFTVLLLFHWVYYLKEAYKKAEFLERKYPEVSQQIRDKLENPEISIPWSNQPGRDISRQLHFLNNHSLNIYSPNYAFPEKEDQ